MYLLFFLWLFRRDVLQDNRQRELLYLVLDEIRKNVDEIRYLQISSGELTSRLNLIIYDIWEKVTRKFLEINASVYDEISKGRLNEIILEEREAIHTEILNKIPFTLDLFSYLLYENSLTIDGVEYRANAPETIARAEILLQNLIHNIANAVTVIILNNFSESERIKQKLYRSEFLIASLAAAAGLAACTTATPYQPLLEGASGQSRAGSSFTESGGKCQRH